MREILCLLVLALFLRKSFAQITFEATRSSFSNSVDKSLPAKNGTGIQWTEGLTWQQVKEKARRENKYIFLDCFTTWCGPCKAMDRDVYANTEVGNFINSKFIAIRVQMDKSKNDNAFVQSWYLDAEEIGKHYLVEGYPTFLFFSPNGAFVHKEMGFRDAAKFISMAQNALTPGKILHDSYAEYTKLISAYKVGDIKYDQLPFMITLAKKLGDTISRELIRLHEGYVDTLPTKQRYTRENIAFWTTLNVTSKSKIVQFFYRDGDLIDKLMNTKGYSRVQVNKCIQSFTVTPFLMEQLNDPDAATGVTTINVETGTAVSNATRFEEADWKKLETLILKDFDKSYAKSNLLQAKVIWYEKNSNWTAYVRASFEKFKIAPPDFSNWLESYNVNSLGWNIFLRIKDKKLIREGIVWMKKLVQRWKRNDFYDTYANLLYKTGRTEKAIQWQEKAVNLNPADKYSQRALEQMKKGEPTYGVSKL